MRCTPATRGSRPRLPVREVPDAAALADVGIAAPGSDVGTGGMESKLTSALTATGAGIPVLLASAADAVAALRVAPPSDDTDGPIVGTAFAPATRRTSARLFWLRHAATASGSISLDHGAVAAVLNRRKSLLPAGITAFYGDFESGDVVDLLAPDGADRRPRICRPRRRGNARHHRPVPVGSAAELRHPVVHADDLIAVPSQPVAAPKLSRRRETT